MPIPDYQSYMSPIMNFLSDRQDHTRQEIQNKMAEHFKLPEDELKTLLPSGKQTYFTNRVGWALTYLKKASLIESKKRAKFCITPEGLDILKSKPNHINTNYLMKFPDFQKFKINSSDILTEPEIEHKEQTPLEIFEVTYQNLRNELAQELLEQIMKCSSQFFEKLVVNLLVAMGYGGSLKDAGEAVGQSGDGGIDGIIKEDKLGLDAIYLQAKRWDSTVGRPSVQAFAGALMGKKANKGVMITTSQFSKEAREYVTTIDKKIVLISGEELAQFMIDYGVGVTDVTTYTLKKIDSDYFEEG